MTNTNQIVRVVNGRFQIKDVIHEMRGTNGAIICGGSAHQTPARFVSEGSRLVRINMAFSSANFCSRSNGIDDALPRELYTIGLSKEEVDFWFIDKLKAVNALRNPGCVDCFIDCFPGFLCFCAGVFCMNSRNIHYFGRWNDALKEWQKTFNEQVLLPKKLYVKTQSHIYYLRAGSGEDSEFQTVVAKWISVAIGDEEVRRLQQEPHIYQAPRLRGDPTECQLICYCVDDVWRDLHRKRCMEF